MICFRCHSTSEHVVLLSLLWVFFSVLTFFKILNLNFFFIFREREREGGNINVWLPLARPLLGTWPTTQACALTRNHTSDPLVPRLALSPLRHTCSRAIFFLFNLIFSSFLLLAVLQMCLFPPLCPLPPSPSAPFPQGITTCYMCPWVIHVCSFADPFTFFHLVPSPAP